MKKTRNQKLQALALRQDYWSIRSVVQLRYLDELLKSELFSDYDLANQAIDRLYELYCEEGNLCKSAVLTWEKEYLEPIRTVAKAIRVDCVGHAHIDMNWQWGYDETVMVTLDTFRTMLQLMREYPDMVFLQSQASVYRIVEEHAPQMLPQIREAIRVGQWETVATTWVEADKNMPNGESMTRHLLYTRQYLKKLLELEDEDFLVDFEPDTFGHAAQIPTILASGGVRYYYHCRGEVEHSLYRWESPSGERVTVLRDPEWYNAPIEWDAFLYIPGYCSQHGLNRMCHVFGMGDHGGGVTRRDIERIHDMTCWPCMPDIGFGKLRDFFAYTDTLDLPVVYGELNFVFDGCYTTQSRIKKGNRSAEAALYTAETMNAISALKGSYPYAPEVFEDAWRKVLFNQFHDILPGSGVTATREHAMGAYQEALACAGVRTGEAVRALSACIDTTAVLTAEPMQRESVSEGAGVGYGTRGGRYTGYNGAVSGENRLYHVFNSTQAPWNGLVELTVWDWPLAPERVSVCDEAGRELPHYLVDAVPLHYWAHYYFRVLVKCPVPAFGYCTLLLRENQCPPEVPVYPNHVFPRMDYPVDNLVLENDCIRVEFDTESLRICSLRDQKTGEEYLSEGKTGGFDFIEEDDSRGMTSWCVGRHTSCRPAFENLQMTGRRQHPLRNSISFTGQVANSFVSVDMCLDQGSRMLKINTHCRWREMGVPGKPIPQLSFSLPLKNCEKFLCDTPFMTLERDIHDYDVPSLSYTCASGVMLTTDSKYGFRTTGDRMSVTLLRSSYDPDDLPEIANHDFVIGVGIPEDHTPKTLLNEHLRFTCPPMTVATMPHEGTLPANGTWMTLEGNVQVSSIKLTEDGTGDMLIRLSCLVNTEQHVRLLPTCPLESAWLTDAHEQIKNDLQIEEDGTVTAVVGPYGVLALRFRFQKNL